MKSSRLLLPLLIATLSACASHAPRHQEVMYTPTMPVVNPAPPPATGSIYHDVNAVELFGDARAHRVGDLITIQLVESTQASKKAQTSTSKKDGVNIGGGSIWGKAFPVNGGSVASLSGERGFDGSGSSSQSNQLRGEITVTVAQRLPNGNLVVQGEKWLTINQGNELVRVSGIVRPQDIQPDNSVASTRVANAQITYAGTGTLASANTQGWLSRFFNSKWMPF